MTCRFGKPLSEDALYATVDGDADMQTITHIAACPYCAKRAAEIRASELWIRQMIHPPVQQILEYVEGLLPDAMMSTVASHIESCPLCQKEEAEFRAAPMPELDEQWLSIPTERLIRPTNQRSIWQEMGAVIAQLIDPAPNMIPVYGEREKHIRYEAQGLDIRLIVTTTIDDKVILEGIITGNNVGWEDVVITLRIADGDEITTRTEDYTFVLNDLPKGPADLLLQASPGGQTVVVAALNLSDT